MSKKKKNPFSYKLLCQVIGPIDEKSNSQDIDQKCWISGGAQEALAFLSPASSQVSAGVLLAGVLLVSCYLQRE